MDKKQERCTGAETVSMLLCCNLLCCCMKHQKRKSSKSQELSEAAGLQIHSQRRSLTVKHLTPCSNSDSACRPTSLPAEPSLVKPSHSATRIWSKAKPRLNATSGCCVSVILLFSFRFACFLSEPLLTPVLLQDGKPSTALLAYKRSLCSDWTPCYRRAL